MGKATKASYLEAINRAIVYIEQHSATNISLEAIATYALLSKYHFHRVFKSIVGSTTKAYLTRLRLEKSAHLLKHSEKTISEIAYDCGYASPEVFNRAFKSYFEVTPTLFRRNTKQERLSKVEHYKNTSFESLGISAPKIVEKKDLNLAYIRHYGSYDQVAKSFQQLMFWATKNLFLKLKPTTLGILHDNPDLTAETQIRFDACVLISKEIQPQGAIGYKRIKGGKFAVFRYKGAYESFYPVYDYIYNICLFEHQWELRDEPALEWYVRSPPFYKPDQYITDFYLPIQ
ncbi:MAG: AraC family transcriptional regulator [Mameliella sp.]|nr:AraC family transcriptional regulator [Phaeodactylibacter sp.]